MSDLISRQAAIDALKRMQKDISGDYTDLDPLVMSGCAYIGDCIGEIQDLPSAQPENKPIEYRDCANAMLRMWMDKVVTDGEYNRIMDKLNAYWMEKNG